MIKFYNYKSTLSIDVISFFHANCSLLFMHVGYQGRISDGGIFRKHKLNTKLQKDSRFSTTLPGRIYMLSYFIAVNDAPPLEKNIMGVFFLEFILQNKPKEFLIITCAEHVAKKIQLSLLTGHGGPQGCDTM
jgi:hypothetical protein